MAIDSHTPQIVITHQTRIALAKDRLPLEADLKVIQHEIPMTWVQDGGNFRLDTTVPEVCRLDILFPAGLESLHVNGERIWTITAGWSSANPDLQVEDTSAGVRFTTNIAGAFHILTVIGSPE